MTSRNRALSGGFSLIEMLVVVVIMGLALSIFATFAPRGHAELELATSTDQLANTLRLARAQAIATQLPVVFAPSRDGHAFALVGQVQKLPSPVTVSVPTAAGITFLPDGSSSGGTILLAVGTRSRVIRVDWLTGRPIIVEFAVKPIVTCVPYQR